MKEPRFYRIGDFAEKLGVTPDLLKYCEKKGLLTSTKEKNGYRYYDFRQSAQVIEYLKLQNQAFSAQEIYSALHADSFRELVSLEQSHQEDYKRKARFFEALIERNTKAEALKNMFTDPPKWTLVQRNPAWFLEHSSGDVLTADPETVRRVAEWNLYLPIVESACCYGTFGSEPQKWGLYVECRYAEQFGLDTSGTVEYIPGGTVLEVYITRVLGDDREYIGRTARSLTAKLGLRQTGDAYHRVISKMWNGNTRWEYSVLNIPVDYDT